jgi:predicted NBD/HSP70 family sugar kinase
MLVPMTQRTEPLSEALRVVSVADSVLARRDGAQLAKDAPATAIVKANQEISGTWNRRLVLALLLRRQKLSRRQIARLTGLRDSTLTYIIRQLQERRIVVDAGKLRSSGAGRKHSLMAINGEVGYVLGISLKQGEARLMLQDLAGKRLAQDVLSLSARRLEQVAPVLREHTEQWLARIGTPPGKLLGVAAGITGIVDVERGLVLYSRMFEASGVPLALHLREQFGVGALIDHDANLGALAEAREGAAVEAADFLYLLVARGPSDRGGIQVGGALYLNRTLYRGVHFAAGEIDDTLIPPALRSVSDDDLSVLARADAALPRRLQGLADEFAAMLGQLGNFLDPATVVLGGDVAMENRQLLARMQDRFDSRLVPTVERRSVPVIASPLGQWGVATGAATAAAERALLTIEL